MSSTFIQALKHINQAVAGMPLNETVFEASYLPVATVIAEMGREVPSITFLPNGVVFGISDTLRVVKQRTVKPEALKAFVNQCIGIEGGEVGTVTVSTQSDSGLTQVVARYTYGLSSEFQKLFGGSDVMLFVRFNKPRSFSLKSLIDNKTIPADIALFVAGAMCFGGIIIICGPQASGKSTLLNALIEYVYNTLATLGKTPPILAYAGDAIDFFLPQGAFIAPKFSKEDDIMRFSRRANAHTVLFGEVAGPSTLSLFFQLVPSVRTIATTMHGGLWDVVDFISRVTGQSRDIVMRRLGVVVEMCTLRTGGYPMVRSVYVNPERYLLSDEGMLVPVCSLVYKDGGLSYSYSEDFERWKRAIWDMVKEAL